MAECSVKSFCSNNPHKCWICQAGDGGDTLYYKKNTPKAPDHPLIVAAKAERKGARLEEKKAASKARMDRVLNNTFDENRNRLKIATEREKKTEKTLRKQAADQFSRRVARSSDGNSGRVANDDDHVILGGEIRYDTKSDSKRVHPIIDLREYDECKAKAVKHGSDAYGQVIYNKDGRAFIVFDFEADWPYIQQKLNLTLLSSEASNDD